MAIQVTSTAKVKNYVNCLVYGDAGVGKTVLSATAPAPLLISAEKGTLSLATYDMPMIEIANRADVDEIYDWLKLSQEAKKYQTICIDSVSQIAELLLQTEKKKNADGRAAYGVMNDEMAAMILGFKDLTYHTYFIAKVRKVTEESGRTWYAPSVPGQQLFNDLPYYFDGVYFMRAKKSKGKLERKLLTQASATYVAKDRSGRLAVEEEPNLTHVFNRILNKTKES